MKIGILTFHCAHNYGAVLQCYALQEYLKGLGHNVEIIDYRPNYLLEHYKIFNINKNGGIISKLKSLVKSFLLLRRNYIRHKKFDSFIRRYLNLSNEKNQISNKYDLYIIGSDQIWNPKITKGFDSIYFANFPFEKEKKIYATYAASMEIKNLKREEVEYLKEKLKNFDFISVRENILCDLLQPLSEKKIEIVLDPTLIVDKKVWDNIAIYPKIKEKYVLIYQVVFNSNSKVLANKIADKIGAKVIDLAAWIYELKSNKNSVQTASPEEFLGLFKYASCIITTSFHGTVFSIINHKPFFYLQVGNGTRVSSLLSQLNLEDRIISNNLEKINYVDLDYSTINKADLYLSSIDYINKIVGAKP